MDVGVGTGAATWCVRVLALCAVLPVVDARRAWQPTTTHGGIPLSPTLSHTHTHAHAPNSPNKGCLRVLQAPAKGRDMC